MDKKGTRQLQPSPKGLATDSKKNQDGAVGKAWPHGSRRREPAGSSVRDPTRNKPNPQRNKTTGDKRPRARGGYQSSAGYSKTDTTRVDEYQYAELESLFSSDSKKQSLAHLLNFQLPPRESRYAPQHHQGNGRSAKDRGGRKAIGTQKHKYKKEHFVQANCQFIVNSLGDYGQYMNNPDALVDWNLIEQVNFPVSESPFCPICLYPPAAAKMTKCGHIYCWHCVLHYLSLDDKALQKCPICYEAVHKKDLKSVVTIQHATFNINETITFRLMKRARGSLTAYPVDVVAREDNVIFNLSDKDCNNIHSKLLLADNSDILAIIERERGELQRLAEDVVNEPEICFIEQAVAFLKEREDVIFGLISSMVTSGNNSSGSEKKGGEKQPAKSQSASEHESEVEDTFSDNVVESPDISYESPGNLKKFFYFYQASDGQHVYLHPVNAKMLEHTYGSLEHAPKQISGRILEKEGGSMTEELRNRLRYLRHLPVTCQFEFAEIQMKCPVVTRETLDMFRNQLDNRRKQRISRLRNEKKLEKRIVEEENRKMGKYPVPNIQLESQEQFPGVGHEARERTLSEDTSTSDASTSSVSKLSTSLTSNLSTQDEHAGPSFAKMLTSAKARQPTWPSLKPPSPSARATSTPVKIINASGTNIKVTPNAFKSDSEPEAEGLEPSPVYFSDILEHAINARHNDESGDSMAVGKKKKKNKKNKRFPTCGSGRPYLAN